MDTWILGLQVHIKTRVLYFAFYIFVEIVQSGVDSYTLHIEAQGCKEW
jgi:hypothetical protein